MPAVTAPRSLRMGQLVRQSFTAMTPVERTRLMAMYGVDRWAARARVRHPVRVRGALPLPGPGHRGGGAGLHPGPAARLRRRPHLRDRQHHPQGDGRPARARGSRARSASGSSSPSATPPSWSPSGSAIIVAEKTVFAAVSDNGSGLERFGGLFGTVVSASFLFLIGLLNLVILAGIVRVFASMRRGEYDEAELERQLDSPRVFLPVLRPLDEGHQQGMAAVPGRGALRAGLRHRHRGGPAGHHRPAGLRGTSPGTPSSACRSCSPPG